MLCASHERCRHRHLSRFVRITSSTHRKLNLFRKSEVTKPSSGYGSVLITDVSARSADWRRPRLPLMAHADVVPAQQSAELLSYLRCGIAMAGAAGLVGRPAGNCG